MEQEVTTQTATPATIETTTTNSNQTEQQTTTSTNTDFNISNYIEPDGKLKSGWKDHLVPEDLRSNKFYDIFTDLKGILKAAGHQAVTIGKYGTTKGVLPINDKSGPNEIQMFRDAMGIPKDSTGYKYTPPEDVSIDENLLKGSLDAFNKANYTQSQVDTAMGLYTNLVRQAEQQYSKQLETQVKESEDRIKNEWGDKYDSRLNLSKSFITKMTNKWSPEKYDELFGKAVEVVNKDGTKSIDRQGGVNAPEYAALRPLLLDLFADIESQYGIEDSSIIPESGTKEAASIQDQITEQYKLIADGKLRSSLNPSDREKHNLILKKIEELTRRLPAKS
jgi:hypothetical protein